MLKGKTRKMSRAQSCAKTMTRLQTRALFNLPTLTIPLLTLLGQLELLMTTRIHDLEVWFFHLL